MCWWKRSPGQKSPKSDRLLLPGQEKITKNILRRPRRPSEFPDKRTEAATKVDGVFSADPMLDKTAKKFNTIHYIDVIKKGLTVMDSTAISLCKDNNMPILVFNLNRRGNIKRAVLGEKVGTLVH